MVCETKIVAAEDHEALPGAKKDALLAAAGAMWPPLPAAPGPAAAPAAPPPAPAPGPQPHGGSGGAEPPGGRGVYIREFRAAEQEAARRIFYDGIMERIPNTAFRGLRQHPRTQLLYALLAGQCAGDPAALRLPQSAPARPLRGQTHRTPSAPVAPTSGPGPRPRSCPCPGLSLGGKRTPPAPSGPLVRARTRTRTPPAFCGGLGRGGHRRWRPGSWPRRAGRGRGNERRRRVGGCGRGRGPGSPPASPFGAAPPLRSLPRSSRVGAG